MVFSSITFLFYFLPIVLALYYIVPNKRKNIVLLVASLLFYFYGEPTYVIIMIASIVFTYIFGILMDKYKKYSKLFLILSICFSIGILIYFKYTNFLIQNINLWLKNKIDFIYVVLPIGISFYTFQLISYIIAGFSYQAISVFMGVKVENLYKRMYRLKERIIKLNPPDKDLFINELK